MISGKDQLMAMARCTTKASMKCSIFSGTEWGGRIFDCYYQPTVASRKQGAFEVVTNENS